MLFLNFISKLHFSNSNHLILTELYFWKFCYFIIPVEKKNDCRIVAANKTWNDTTRERPVQDRNVSSGAQCIPNGDKLKMYFLSQKSYVTYLSPNGVSVRINRAMYAEMRLVAGCPENHHWLFVVDWSNYWSLGAVQLNNLRYYICLKIGRTVRITATILS